MDAFLKIDGIEGESMDDKHKGEMEILSYSWGVTQEASGVASTAGGLSAGRGQFQDLSVVKLLDKASPKLAIACAAGEHFRSACLSLHRAGGEKELYTEYKLTDVLITSVCPRGDREGERETIPQEVICMNYGKIELKYVPTKVEGGKGSGSVVAGWDLKLNKRV